MTFSLLSEWVKSHLVLSAVLLICLLSGFAFLTNVRPGNDPLDKSGSLVELTALNDGKSSEFSSNNKLIWTIASIDCAGKGLISRSDIRLFVSDNMNNAAAPLPGFINEQDLTLNGASVIGESGCTIMQIFGAPLSVNKNKDRSIHDQESFVFWETWVYQGIECTFFSIRRADEAEPEMPDRLFMIKILDVEYATARGITIGDSLEKVYQTYGEWGQIIDQTLTYEGLAMEIIQFLFEQEMVKEIVLAFALN